MELLLVDVNVGTVREIERILRRGARRVPRSRNWILQRLANAGRSTTRQRLNVALEYLYEHGWVIEGSKGILWTHNESPSLQNAILHGRRL